MKIKKGLAKHIQKHITYDGDGGSKCPKCGHLLEPINYWIDHKSGLAGEIINFLGTPFGQDRITELLGDIYPITGQASKDAAKIAKEIHKLIK